MNSTNQCPKCSGQNIYTDAGQAKLGDRTSIRVSSFHQLFIDRYVCVDCGYLEEYVEKVDLESEKKMDKLKSNWRKR